MKPTEEEIEVLVNFLVKKLSTRFINILFKEDSAVSEIEKTLDQNFTNAQKLRILIYQKESKFFAGGSDRTIELRKKLLDLLEDYAIDHYFDKLGNSGGKSRAHKIGKLSSRRWISGKSWPSTFVRIFNLPLIFAGVGNDQKKPVTEDIDPFIVPPPLTEFQLELKNELLSTLNRENEKTRCIISLPTGGGKTRTAVEAFIEWLMPRFAEGKYLVWIAQSEELCEQVIECIRQMWASKQFYESLRIYRYFGSTTIEESDLIGGVVVASINQLYSRLGGDYPLFKIIENTGAIIIDEAHRASTMMYTDFFKFCKERSGEELFPICGLTATPGRSQNQTHLLVDLFESKLFTPTLGEEFENNPLKYFRQHKYLAVPIPEQVFTNVDIPVENTLFEETFEEFEHRMNQVVISKLASNKERNKKIIDRLLQIPSGKKTIIYGCTVDHAKMLSTALNYLKRSSTVISSDTPRHYRRKLLNQFKTGEIEFVFNYGVLTTGFDAPRTEYIVICRPTFSPVLYEQIVGRGLRGPKFGGTETCHIIDFCDNYKRFGDQQAYNRFSEFWN